jgi:alpha-beta hydrolase superfamily lysophospholipase
VTPDPRGHGAAPCADLGRVVMADYVDDVRAAAREIAAPPVVAGSSVGAGSSR